MSSPIQAYTECINKIIAMIEEIKELCLSGVIKVPGQQDGMLQSNKDKAKVLLDELVQIIKKPNTGYTAFDVYVTNLMGVRTNTNGTRFLLWNEYTKSNPAETNMAVQFQWFAPFFGCCIHPSIGMGWWGYIEQFSDKIIVALKYVLDPSLYDIAIWAADQNKMHIPQAYVSARSYIELTEYVERSGKSNEIVEALRYENDQLRKQQDADHKEIQHLKFKLCEIERKFAPELIEYDYDEIKSRINPIRAELKMMHRVFVRALRLRYNTPVAIAMPVKEE